ncbi:MAG: T9SS type A sorting domain-containing protein [Chitinophagaceae bacterium]|nr:T9SS type A sorting domain-containing protein [Chitinophagaceae bacterium]
MRKNFTLIILLLLTITSSAQLILPSVVNSGGSSGVVNTIHFEFNMGEVFSSTITNDNIITQGLLQPLSAAQSPLPVTGLQFTAKRITASQVKIDWSTLQEMNNSGFYIERKKADEADFTPLTFIPSKASGGNSSSPLSYAYTDINEYAGKTYYRLRQVDIDQKFTYSPVRIVEGTAEKSVVLKAWPVPVVDNLHVKVTGIDKTEQLQVIDMQGRMIKRYSVTNGQTIIISGLQTGTYILRLNKDVPVTEKIVVQ